MYLLVVKKYIHLYIFRCKTSQWTKNHAAASNLSSLPQLSLKSPKPLLPA